MIAWHYSLGIHRPSIYAAGVIRPAPPNADKRGDVRPEHRAAIRELYGTREKPAVWFSLRQDWESTVAAPYSREAIAEEFGLVRYGLDEACVPLGWTYHVNTSGIRRQGAKALAMAAREAGANPADWRVSYEPVPVAACLVEVFDPRIRSWKAG